MLVVEYIYHSKMFFVPFEKQKGYQRRDEGFVWQKEYERRQHAARESAAKKNNNDFETAAAVERRKTQIHCCYDER